jgi:hypothetical protein
MMRQRKYPTKFALCQRPFLLIFTVELGRHIWKMGECLIIIDGGRVC